jgi:alpha-tubulin suppressor-like RCC1 family protein
VLLSVDAVGLAPFTYQWLRNGRSLGGETSRALVINPVAMGDDGMRLSVTVTDAANRSVTSTEAVVRVLPAAPVVSSQPLDVVAIDGQDALFVAATTASVAQSLQWERSNDGGQTWGAAPSQDARLRLPGVRIVIDDGALFRLVATVSTGSVTTRSARLTVIPAPTAPQILTGPDDAQALAGRSASFAVVTSGGALMHEWQRSDASGPFARIAGAPDAATLTLSNVTQADDGARFRVIVRNTLGTAISSAATLRVASTVNASLMRLAGGEGHSLALRADGQLFSWGANTSGQLGLAGLVSSAPAAVPGLTDIATFAAGWNHSLAIRGSGEVLGWGSNNVGQVGDGSRTQRNQPVVVTLPAPARHVAGGPSGSMALDSTAGHLAWGSIPLGDGQAAGFAGAPQRVRGVSFVRIAAGRSHVIALRSDGSVWAWGENTSGQLGTGDRAARLVPTPIAAPPRVVALAAGNEHSLLLTADGRVYAFGLGSAGRLGLGGFDTTLAPAAVALPGIAVGIAAGRSHSLALLADGRVYAWGLNDSGQVGDGSNLDSTTPARVDAAWALPVQSIGAGARHSLALDAAGRVWAWGENAQRQLGDGNVQLRNRPQEVPGVNLN